MEIRNVKLTDIKPYERNAKKHPLNGIKSFNCEFGDVKPWGKPIK